MHNRFDGTEVENHAVGRGTLLLQGGAFDGDVKFVGMAVDVVTFALVGRQGVGHFEGEPPGESE